METWRRDTSLIVLLGQLMTGVVVTFLLTNTLPIVCTCIFFKITGIICKIERKESSYTYHPHSPGPALVAESLRSGGWRCVEGWPAASWRYCCCYPSSAGKRPTESSGCCFHLEADTQELYWTWHYFLPYFLYYVFVVFTLCDTWWMQWLQRAIYLIFWKNRRLTSEIQ